MRPGAMCLVVSKIMQLVLPCYLGLSDLRGIPALAAGEEEAAGCRALLPRIPSCAFPRRTVEGVRALPVAGSWAGPAWIGVSQRLRLILHAPVVSDLGLVRRRDESLRPQQDDYSLGLPRRPQPVGESYRAPRGLFWTGEAVHKVLRSLWSTKRDYVENLDRSQLKLGIWGENRGVLCLDVHSTEASGFPPGPGPTRLDG
ncbi:hypothetical protein NDU88_001652 [Pleurodeles waltl]|uniref:Uncharacterized protein n=1 Tax=Pleurodeles waltl TaxID=8319 RepID=A0AAV7T0H8_PLEWA|nr:hypothetical protein NDU88_001652 [Pleurodeles waltl]